MAKDREILYRQTKIDLIDLLTHEMAVLKRWKFGRSHEQLDAGQIGLLDEIIDAAIDLWSGHDKQERSVTIGREDQSR